MEILEHHGLTDYQSWLKSLFIDYSTHVAFTVTAWHEHVGTVVHYFLPPNGLGFKIRPGKESLDVQAFVQSLCLIGLTGLKNPMIMSNWKHLLPDRPDVKKLHDELMEDLQKIVEEVDKLNSNVPNPKRSRVCQTFNPKFFETSVSV